MEYIIGNEESAIFDQSFDTLASEMGENGQLFPLTDNTDDAAVNRVQQQYLFISNLHRFTLD